MEGHMMSSRALVVALLCLGLWFPAQARAQAKPDKEKPLTFAATFLPKSKPVNGIQKGTGPLLIQTLPEVQIARQFGALDPGHIDALKRHGFFIAPSRATHLYQIYERNDYLRVPSFITTDLMIDLTHAFIESILMNVEERELYPRLNKLCEALWKEAAKMRRESKKREVRRASGNNLFFFAVAARLAGQKPKLPRAIRARVDRLHRRIMAVNKQPPPGAVRIKGITSPQFLDALKTIGHYDRSNKLKQYFRAMSWLSTVYEPLRGEDANPIRAALVLQTIRRARVGKVPVARMMKDMVAVSDMFVGQSGEATPLALMPAYEGAFGATASPDGLAEPDALVKFVELTAKQPAAGAKQARPGRAGDDRGMVFLGRRDFADILHLRRVALDRDKRLYFSGLDVAAALTSPWALDLLKKHDPRVASWKKFDKAFFKGMADLEGKLARQKEMDVYHGTLHALRFQLSPRFHPDFPSLGTTAWQTKSIQSFLSGWAELRHTFQLYGTMSGAECDHPSYPPPPGAVEPYAELYRRLRAMVERLEARLTAAGMMFGTGSEDPFFVSGAKEKFKLIKNALKFCERISKKHLARMPLTRKEREKITTFGGAVEQALITLSDNQILSDRDKEMAKLSGVATIGSRVLHAAVGRPDVIYVLVRVNGKLTLMRGATMSYYEFLTPGRRRLADEKWHQMLSARRQPPRPIFLREIFRTVPPEPRNLGAAQFRCRSDYEWLEL